jgi:hypothetical protein
MPKLSRKIRKSRVSRAPGSRKKFQKNFETSNGAGMTGQSEFIQKKCSKRGNEYPHNKDCPAKGKKCNQCGIFEHFSKVCRGKKNAKKLC